jgi:hypothetical protein
MAKFDKDVELQRLQNEDKDRDRALMRSLKRYDTIRAIGVPFVKGAAIVGIVYSLAGKYTVADLRGMPWDVLQTSVIVGLSIIAIGTTMWAWSERKLRKDSIRELSEEITRLKERNDPNRQTSGLTKSGTTQKGD